MRLQFQNRRVKFVKNTHSTTTIQSPERSAPPAHNSTLFQAEEISASVTRPRDKLRKDHTVEPVRPAPVKLDKKKKQDTMARKERTGKLIHGCQYCLQWFTTGEMMGHFKACKLSARGRNVECTYCSEVFRATSVFKHVVTAHPEISWATKKQPVNSPPKAATNAKRTPTSALAAHNPGINRPQEEERTPCRFCELRIRISDMDRHMATSHTWGEAWTPLGSTHKLPFELLPPARDGIRNIIERYKKQSRDHHRSLSGEHMERLEYIDSFCSLIGPVEHHIGKKSWKGYVVFVFQHNDRVVLESPQLGNATYLLEGNWREMISATKAELRSEFSHLVERVFHIDSWKDNIRHALVGSRRKSIFGGSPKSRL